MTKPKILSPAPTMVLVYGYVTAEKSNEITAPPELLDQNTIEDSVVTNDAAGCQKNIAAKIIQLKRDYVLSPKGSQGNLQREVVDYVAKHMKSDFREIEVRKHIERVKGFDLATISLTVN